MGSLRNLCGGRTEGTDSARRDCCRPVPHMTTSQVVSLSDSMVVGCAPRRGMFLPAGDEEKKRLKIARGSANLERQGVEGLLWVVGGPSS